MKEIDIMKKELAMFEKMLEKFTITNNKELINLTKESIATLVLEIANAEIQELLNK